MKKKLFCAFFAIAVMIVTGINYYQVLQYNNLSDLALANIEALATDELDEELKLEKWDRYDYKLDNGTPAVNCIRGGTSNCLLS